jgi:flagellar hook-basal body complex protein FliE
MSAIETVAAVGASAGDPLITSLGAATRPEAASGPGFASILAEGMRAVDAKVADANALVRRFALDDTVPVHQVTYALEEARLAVELAMQVRGRLVESYRELMNMQL